MVDQQRTERSAEGHCCSGHLSSADGHCRSDHTAADWQVCTCVTGFGFTSVCNIFLHIFTQVIITLYWRWFSIFFFFSSWWLSNWDFPVALSDIIFAKVNIPDKINSIITLLLLHLGNFLVPLLTCLISAAQQDGRWSNNRTCSWLGCLPAC